jgi:hypothetical protein
VALRIVIGDIQILRLPWCNRKRHDARQEAAVPRPCRCQNVSRMFVPEEEYNMKKPALVSVIAFLTFLPFGIQAQNTDSASYHNSDSRKSSKKPTSLSGEVGSEGKTFTADKDRRIWKVINPEILNGIDAHHVRVRAHVDAANGQIHILSVNAITEQHSGIKLDDAAFRR